MVRRRETLCIHSDQPHRDETNALSFPIYQSATFGHTDLGGTGFAYSREKNPTRSHLEQIMSTLEGAASTSAFSSGMAAVSACFELFAPSDHIVCTEDLYGGVTRLFEVVTQKNGVTVSFVDTSDLAAVEQEIRPHTRAIYIETPSNPMMKVSDIAALARLAHSHGLLLIVDNTFLSPYLQNPIALGADLVIHSGTKFIAGHNDTIAGFVCAGTPGLGDRIALIAKTTGAGLAPFDAWLVERGVKTLAVRMNQQEHNAHAVAQWLTQHPHVTEVLYVGLPENPGFRQNARQARGAGAMISFRTDTPQRAQRMLKKIHLVTFAESLGGVESLLTYPLTQTHADVPELLRKKLGITDTLLRLSVGIEAADDIISDLAQALE